MKVMITGAAGQLGQELVKQFQFDHQVVGVTSQQLNITDTNKVAQFIKDQQPQLIIHAAAWTNVDQAALNPADAMAVNGQGTRNIAMAARENQAKLIYISTNEVFAGQAGKFYEEAAVPDPINPYGQSKLAGEQAVQEVMGEGQWTITRVSWLYGPTSVNNFPNKIIAAADRNGSLKVVDDEVSTPTFCPDVVKSLIAIVDQGHSGVFHLVNQGHCSRFDWAKQLLQDTGRGHMSIEPIKLKDYPRPTTVPPHAVLTNSRLSQVSLPDWQESSRKYCSDILFSS